MKFIGDDSLVQSTIKRLSPVLDADCVRIVCGEQHFHEIVRHMQDIGLPADGKIICEPSGRNTAPAILLAVLNALNTDRDDILLALAHGIISFQIESISTWRKSVRLSKEIYHVGGGASDAYTGYKQRMLKDYRFVQLGETTLTGAAKLAIKALQ